LGLQSINKGIEDGTRSDIEESTKSKFYEYDTDWESSREGILLVYYIAVAMSPCSATGTCHITLHYTLH